MARTALAALVALGPLAACSSGGSDDEAAPTTEAPPASTTTDVDDDATTTTGADVDPDAAADCPDPDDVAELVGGPVDQTASGGGESTSGGLSYSYEGCGYRLEDAGRVGVTRVTEATGPGEGATTFDLLEAAAQADGNPGGRGLVALEGLGDTAYRDDDEEVAVLQGSRMLFVELDPEDDDAPASTVMVQAEAVAGALLELDLTVEVSELCPGVEAAVADALGPVAGSEEQLGGKAVNDVSFETVGCVVELEDGSEVEVDVADSVDWDAWVEAEGGVVEGGAFAALTIGELSAFDTGEALVVDDGDEPLRITTEDLEVDAAAAAELRLALAELALGGGGG